MSDGVDGIQAPTMDLLPTDQVGRAGERFVAYQLERMGVQCSLVDRTGCDLWACMPSGGMWRVEVKTAQKPLQWTTEGKKGYSPAYHFRTMDKLHSDFHALVALDIERVLFWPTPSIRTNSLQIRQEIFQTVSVGESIEAMIWTADIKKAA